MKKLPEDVVKAARDAECEALAREVARLCLMPVEILGGPLGDHEFTFVDVLRMATANLAILNKQVIDWTTQEKNLQFLERIHAAALNPDDLYEFLRNRLLEGTEPLEELQKATAFVKPLIADREAAVRFVRQRVDESLGKTRQGRPSRFHAGRDTEPFLSLSARLVPYCLNVLDLMTRLPDKSLTEVITFVVAHSQEDYRLLTLHQAMIQELARSDSFRRCRSMPVKARRLADAVAGSEMFGWEPGYSSERGDELRRLKARKERG